MPERTVAGIPRDADREVLSQEPMRRKQAINGRCRGWGGRQTPSLNASPWPRSRATHRAKHNSCLQTAGAVFNSVKCLLLSPDCLKSKARSWGLSFRSPDDRSSRDQLRNHVNVLHGIEVHTSKRLRQYILLCVFYYD